MLNPCLIIFLYFAFLLGINSGSCANQRVLESGSGTPLPESSAKTPEEQKDDFAERLKGVRSGDFDYVFVFRRKDKEAFTAEDKAYLKANSPADTNQWVITGDQRAVIAGSNYIFTSENLSNLAKRFDVEDYSKKAEELKKQ